MTSIPISFNLATAQVAVAANKAGLTVQESDGLHITSGGDYAAGLSATDFTDEIEFQALSTSTLKTLTTAEFTNLHLVAGETLVVDYDFVALDPRYNDVAFAMIKDPQGRVTPILLGDGSSYYGTGLSHHLLTFNTGSTGSFNLMFGASDVGDTTEPDFLIIHSITTDIPQGSYTLTSGGIQLSDGSSFTPDGSLLVPGAAAAPGLLSTYGTNLIATLDGLVGSGLIGQDGNGLVSNSSGTLVSNSSGTLVSNSSGTLVSNSSGTVDGSGLLSLAASNANITATSSLIVKSGDGLIRDEGSSLLSQNGNGLRGDDGSSLTANLYKDLSLDDAGQLSRTFSNTTPGPAQTQTGPATVGTPTLVSAPANTHSLQQITPAIAALPGGGTVVTWTSYDPTTIFGSQVFEQLVNADGSLLGTAHNLSGQSSASSENQSVAGLAGGGIVVAWSDVNTIYTSAGPTTVSRIRGVLLDSNGGLIGAAATPAAATANQGDVALAALSGGGFVEVWRVTQPSGATTVSGQRFNVDGTANGAVFAIGTALATSRAANPSVAALHDGGFVVAYADPSVTPGITAELHAGNGLVLPLAVASGSDAVERPAMATLASGNVVIAWVDDASDGTASVHAQIFSAAGVVTGSAFVVTTSTIPNLDPPAVAALADGRFVVSWTAAVTVGTNTRDTVLAQAYNADGSLSGGQFAGTASSYATESALARLANGTLVVASSDSKAGSTEIRVEPVSFKTTGAAVPAAPGIAVPGAETLVSATAASPLFDKDPSVAALPNGTFATAWTVAQGAAQSIQVQLADPSGAPRGSAVTILPIATKPLDADLSPTVVKLSTGGFAVVYMESYSVSTSTGFSTPVNVYAQFFDAAGTRLGTPTLLSATDGVQVTGLTASTMSDGSFLVLDTQYTYATSATALVAQRFTASGAAIGNPLPVAVGKTINTQGDAVTALPDNGFAVAFANVASGGGSGALPTGLYLQVFDSAGAVAAPVLVRASSGAIVMPAIARLTDGNLAVVWNEGSGKFNSANTTVFGQVVAPAGSPIGAPFAGPTGTFSNDPPAVTALADGRFIVAYDTQVSGIATVQAQIYNADGSVSGGALPGSAAKTTVTSPALAQLTNGTIEIASTHAGGTAGGSDIRAESVSIASAPDVAATAQGRAVDGDIAGATVFADANGDGIYEPGEATATTDALGRYNFITPASGPIIMAGGTDASTGLAFKGTLSAPAGSLTISPLSTLVEKLVQAGASLTNAQLEVNAAFGLAADADLTTLDPVRSTLDGLPDGPQSFLAAITVQDVVSLATAAGAAGDLYAGIAAEIAAAPGRYDPTTLASVQGLGLSGGKASTTAALASAGYQLAAQQVASHASDPVGLLATGGSLERLEQGAAADGLSAATTQADLDSLVASYTGSNLSAAVACYCAGTRITTEHGDTPVEALVAGDLVMTVSGVLRPIRWIGHRSYAGRFLAANALLHPVCIKAAALGGGLPRRDLLISPEHAMFLGGMLIPAHCLVDGMNVTRVRVLDRVQYFHVELDQHDVILAEGAPSETFLDDDSRAIFHNAASFVAPDPSARDQAGYCAPRVTDGYALDAVRKSIARACVQSSNSAASSTVRRSDVA